MCAHTCTESIHIYTWSSAVPYHTSTGISLFTHSCTTVHGMPYTHFKHSYTTRTHRLLNICLTHYTLKHTHTRTQIHTSTHSIYHAPQVLLHHNTSFPACPIIHTHSYACLSIYAHPQPEPALIILGDRVLKFGCIPPKHRFRKVNTGAAFQYSGHFSSPSWTEEIVYFGLMAYGGHRYTPEICHSSVFLGKASTCHVSHAST